MCELLCQRFWWPSLEKGVQSSICACVPCYQHTYCCQVPSGLLQPLPVPSRLWLHLFLDFIMRLPCSIRSTVNLTIVNRFSTFYVSPEIALGQEDGLTSGASRFSSPWTSHGCGSQFASTFWTEFCRQVGPMLSLSSGFHIQSTRQTDETHRQPISN